MSISPTPQLLQRVCDVYGADFECLGYERPAACAPLGETSARMGGALEGGQQTPRGASPPGDGKPISPSAGSAATIRATPTRRAGSASLKGLTPLLRADAASDEAPLFAIASSAGSARTGRLRIMSKRSEFRNSLFLYPDDVMNHSSYRPPSMSDPLDPHGDAHLRPYNRFGWAGKQLMPPPLAPLSVGIPTGAYGEAYASPMTAGAEASIDAAVLEAARLLLLHRYDQVLFSKEVFGIGGRALLTVGVGVDVVEYIQRRVAELVDPVQVASGGAGGGGGGNDQPPKGGGRPEVPTEDRAAARRARRLRTRWRAYRSWQHSLNVISC